MLKEEWLTTSSQKQVEFASGQPEAHSAITECNTILQAAIQQGASDIHFEPKQKQLLVRIRQDGLLSTYRQYPANTARCLTQRIKILAECDISEQRLPQDGRFQFQFNDTRYDCRLSTCPTLHGEKVVIRLLKAASDIIPLAQLAFAPRQANWLHQALNTAHGLILVTGPTGSGKTNTLYAMLQHLEQQTRNICSIEDPVEIELAGINQIAVKPSIGWTFPRALKTLLRQDPDVIMIGELRDEETANIAIKAAQTGHLVLATLHTNTAAQTIVRLRNMGIPGYQIAAALNLVLSQRLVRKCSVNGYQDRHAIFECLPLTQPLKLALATDCCMHVVQTFMQQNGIASLIDAAKLAIEQGITDQAEVDRLLTEIEL